MAEAGWAVENLREALLCRPGLPPGGRHGGGGGVITRERSGNTSCTPSLYF